MKKTYKPFKHPNLNYYNISIYEKIWGKIQFQYDGPLYMEKQLERKNVPFVHARHGSF